MRKHLNDNEKIEFKYPWEIMRKMELVISDIIEITIRDLLKDMFL